MTNALKQIHLFIFFLARLMSCVWHLFPNERLVLKYKHTKREKKTSLDDFGAVDRVKTRFNKRMFSAKPKSRKAFLKKARRTNLWK